MSNDSLPAPNGQDKPDMVTIKVRACDVKVIDYDPSRFPPSD